MVNETASPYGEELDFEDLALIDSVVDVLELDKDDFKHRNSTEWEMDTLIDELEGRCFFN
jgi:hypothetical protein